MKKLIFAGAVAALVSACGGGGGGGGSPNGAIGSGSGASTPAPVNRLAPYVGTWASDCSDHGIETATITSPSDNTLKIAVRTEYYKTANCTGAVIATESDGMDVTAIYVDTVDASVVLGRGTPAVTAKIQKITANKPQATRTVTGTGVTRVVQGGKAQWCIVFDGGSSTCIVDDGPQPAESGVAGALYLQGNILYELVPNASLYEAYGRYIKK